MLPIRRYTERFFSSRRPYAQVLFVFLAFGLMVVASYFMSVEVEKQHLRDDTVSMSEYISSQLALELRDLDSAQAALSDTGLGMFLMKRFSSTSSGKYDNNWLLLNDRLTIIAHFDPALVGVPLRDVPGGLSDIAPDLEMGDTVFDRKFINHLGESKILSIGKLENGWYLGVATLTDSYYRNLHTIQGTLLILGLIMATGLSVTLIRIAKGKGRAEERTKIMLNASPYGINFLDRQYRIIDCNQAALDMFGVADKNEYRENFYTYSPEFQPNGVLSDEWRITVLDKVYNKNGGQFEWVHRKPDGELLPLEVTFVCSIYEGQGIYIAYMRDLREEKLLEKEKERAISEKDALVNMANILNGLDVMIYVTEPDTGKILFMNNSMKEHYGIEGDCIGQLCYKVLQENYEERCSFCPCYKLDKDPGRIIVWEEHSTLTKRIYRNTDRYIPWPSGQMVHMQHSVDMTELVGARDAAEQSSRYKSAFLANMSHEIRTPMNAILGIAEIQLRDANLTAESEDAFRKIYESGDLLINIINDILDLSKIEAGKLELIPVKYDIPSLINDTAQLNRLRYESKPITFTIEVDENSPLELLGDELRIKQVLNNVLSNAFKYTDEGRIELTVYCEPEGGSEDDVTIVFNVSDTGQGMTEDQIDTLFDEYTRFNAGANRSTIGAGLGMSITSRLVSLMDGRIIVKSEPNKGTVFTVRIPQKRASSAVCGADLTDKLRNFRFQSMAVTKRTQFLREYMPYGRVMVVDDVESNVYVAKGMLVPYGLGVDTCSSGYEAIEKIKGGNEYDVIFMDHMMPKMDGIEATKIIRGMGYKRPIVALTANALIGRAEMFMRNGFDGFVSKPIDSRELNAVLNEFIRNRQPADVVETARRVQRETGLGSAIPAVRDTDTETSNELKASFVRDAQHAVNVLEKMCAKKIDALSDNETAEYTTTVHGMKSALANIGEKDLAFSALTLEQAGKDKNYPLMSSGTPAFIEALQILIKKTRPAQEAPDGTISGEDLAWLNERLLEVKNACGVFDTKTANAALDDLKRKIWPHRVKEALDNIAAHLLHSSFDEAAEAARKIEA
ncbi:MAG: ATP-binding protein [Chitinispirillia bacterium]|nr:ATP-binding protein [Chitinispirillia bacterium]MCL2242800.1 ATP-binding protein [Chitinispirillia bacterium]